LLTVLTIIGLVIGVVLAIIAGIIVPVYAIVIAGLILAVVAVVIIYNRIVNSLPGPKFHESVIIIFSVIIGLAAIFTYVSVIVEDVPINHFVDKAETRNMSIFIDREPIVLVPLKNVVPFPPHTTNIYVTLYHNPNIKIDAVKLSTTDSILSYPAKFESVNSTSEKRLQRDNYKLEANANHNLEISNTTKPYSIDVILYNGTSTIPQKWSVPFNWTIKTMNMSIFSYFWIVLIGVLVSRLLSLVLDKLEEIQKTPTAQQQAIKDKPIVLNINDYVWITFSFIIAILIFSSFSTQVDLTTNIVINISLAFGFGFGFDKVLEVAKRFQNI
jgi:hypothetical protein